MEPKRKITFKTVLIAFLALLGLFFIIIMLMPDDEEDRENEYEISDTDTREADEAEETGSEREAVADNRRDKVEEARERTQQSIEKRLKTEVDAISVGTDAKSATVMIYMNGSDLETNAGAASRDIEEMLSSGIGENVNVVLQTMGTKKWWDYGISSKTAQTWEIRDGELVLVRDKLGQLDCTSKDTLSEFINFGKKNYPADRYIFLFWDHGGGPVYGFGYDEWQSPEKSLTLSDMLKAFKENSDIHFDIIGMDCCIMANIETCYALAPFCRYALLSEDFESALGWSYTRWMERLENDPGISTPLLGKYIVDDIVEENENSPEGDSTSIGLFNVSTAMSLFSAWKDYAYKNEEALLGTNFSRLHLAKGRSSRGLLDLWLNDQSDVTLSDYYISDILALIESIDNESDEAKNLMSALKAAVVYYGHTEDKNELTGLSVSLPYGDEEFYDRLKDVYEDVGVDSEYIDWLGAFVEEDQEDYYDFSVFEDLWNGWADYESEYGCNISNGGACEYGYDYDSDEYADEWDEEYSDDDWIYDYDEELWYTYDDDMLYLYDDETELLYYYDEENDELYYYDEEDDDWYFAE